MNPILFKDLDDYVTWLLETHDGKPPANENLTIPADPASTLLPESLPRDPNRP